LKSQNENGNQAVTPPEVLIDWLLGVIEKFLYKKDLPVPDQFFIV
jgi:hypothetical protein